MAVPGLLLGGAALGGMPDSASMNPVDRVSCNPARAVVRSRRIAPIVIGEAVGGTTAREAVPVVAVASSMPVVVVSAMVAPPGTVGLNLNVPTGVCSVDRVLLDDNTRTSNDSFLHDHCWTVNDPFLHDHCRTVNDSFLNDMDPSGSWGAGETACQHMSGHQPGQDLPCRRPFPISSSCLLRGQQGPGDDCCACKCSCPLHVLILRHSLGPVSRSFRWTASPVFLC